MNRAEIVDALEHLRPFKSDTIAGTFVGKRYVVFSYSTEIASFDGSATVSDTYYSNTTSRHQNLCRNHLGKRFNAESDVS